MAVETPPRAGVGGMAGFLLGASAMFAAMYSTQAILPVLGDEFGVGPARAGLTISVLVAAVAAGGWIWGPFSDRFGRRRSLTLASGLLIAPTIGVALAPSFTLLLACRGLQGLCMPGLLAVGVPYVAEVFGPLLGGRAMGYYVGALVFGGILGRVGVGLLTAAVGWRAALGLVALLPAAAVLAMWRLLPEAPAPPRAQGRLDALADQLRNRPLLVPTVCGATLFFSFVGVFSYVTFRLQATPFDYGTEAASLIFVLWIFGAAGPFAGRLADRVGWRRVVVGSLALALAGLAVSLPDALPTVVLGLAMVIFGMFSGVTAAQLGVAAVTDSDRGTASALYFTAYYVGGALAGFLPGLAWQAWAWPGVAALSAAALATGLLVALVGPRQPTPR